MFVRVKNTPNSPRQSVQIVESWREGGKVRQRIVRHVGIAADNQELEHLKSLAELIKAKIEEQIQPALFSPEELAKLIHQGRQCKQPSQAKVVISELRGEQVVTLGIHDVYGELYRQLGLERILPRARYRASNAALMHCVMARIAHPASKRASVQRLGQQFGVQLSLDRVYRMMDRLDAGCISRLKRLATEQAQQLFKQPLDVLFFDCTTLHFESFVEDALKQPGYSKDAKFKECQVLLALMVTPAGVPVSYELLPGATFEGHSLIPLVEKLRTEFELRNVVCVADRGLLSNDNLQALQVAGMYYIVGARLKSLPRKVQAQVLELDAYERISPGGLRVRSLSQGRRRVVVSHCPKRAAKDEKDRQRALKKLHNKLKRSDSPAAFLNDYGYKKFIRLEGDASFKLDEDKIEQARKWDGLHGVITNVPDMDSAEVLSHYHGLWQVEETFRISKHDLRVRPIYHWTPARVHAHIAISFMALMCVRHLGYRARLQYKALSPEVVRNALLRAQYGIVKDRRNAQRYAIPMQLSQVAKKLYWMMGVERSSVPFEID